MPRLALIISIIFLLSMPLYADYHYASHTGASTYPYTSWEAAADSIQKAINTASAGDTVYVGSGTWQESNPTVISSDLAIIGWEIDSTIISTTRTRSWLFEAYDGTLISGFTFDGIVLSQRVWAIEIAFKHDVTIKDNRFRNLIVGINGIFTGEVSHNIFSENEYGLDGSFAPCSLLVSGNTFTGTTGQAIQSYQGHWEVRNNLFARNPLPGYVIGVNIRRPQDFGLVANNLFFRNGVEYNIFVAEIAAGPGTVVENNTFVGREGRGDYMGVYLAAFGDSTPVVCRNNVISGFDEAFFPDDAIAKIEVSFCDLWGNRFDRGGNGRVFLGEGIVRADPMFEDTSSFRLQAYSPLIDAGDPNILDVDGTRSDIGYTGGPDGCSYSYLDLPPRTPDSLRATVAGDSIIINWRMSAEADFDRYIVSRDTLPDFTPWAGNIISEPDTNILNDLNWDRSHNYYYKIAACDNQSNLSPYSAEISVINVGIFGEEYLIPQVSSLEGNYPNPFNSETTIRYHLADIGYQPAEVKIIICDITGRLIRTLIDTRQYPGDYRTSWDGRDESGGEAASGMYFTRLSVSGIELTRAKKITLLK